MKEILILLCLASSSFCSATTYYVATGGNDNNAGTIDKPWKTWGKGFTSTSVKAGDTVYIRGGVYPITVTNGDGYTVTRAGTSDNWIVYSNYPGEVPVLDCYNADPGNKSYNSGIGGSTSTGANYIKFKGLTVKHVRQLHSDHMVYVSAFGCENGNFIFENCTAADNEGLGFESNFYYGYPSVDGNHYFINCDAYNCVNPTNPPGYLPGNRGTGFATANWYDTQGHAYVINCRAWKCGDQGFSWNGEHYCEAQGCWSFNNGVLQGDGHGFKLGWHERNYNGVNVVIKNCIAAYNRASGMTTNDADQGIATGMNIYNNIAYHNGYKGGGFDYTYGFVVYNTPDNTVNEAMRVFRNNISYKNEGGAINVGSGAAYTHSNNSWDIPIAFSDADFLSVDSTGLAGPRQADGSLPDIDFLKPSSKSKAIDAGIDVGMPYNGSAPDLGFLEYGTRPKANEPPTISIANPVSGSTITDQTSITILANVSDPDGTVTKVEFYSGLTKLGEKMSSPWSFTWNNITSGTYALTAVATDNSDAKTTSAAVSIIVSNSSKAVSVSGITVTGQGGVSIIKGLGNTLQVNANVLPANATNKLVNWSIQNGTGQATISTSGLVTAVTMGTVLVKATAKDGSGISGTLPVTITNQVVAVESIVVYTSNFQNSITVKGGSLQLFVNILPANASDKSVKWSLLNEGMTAGTINSSGLLTAKANGQVTVKATATDGSGVSGILDISIENQNTITNTDNMDIRKDPVLILMDLSRILIQLKYKDMFSQIFVYNMTGILVLHNNLSGETFEIDRTNLIPGNYLIVLWGKEERKTIKISIP